MGLVVKVLCGHFCIACLRPLTQRYANIQINPFLNAYILGCGCK
ncbi:TPA: hypothetical protein I7304_21620 [Vibrio vulnificus]|nr:hypothetical protein [Vibrio vulnificus]